MQYTAIYYTQTHGPTAGTLTLTARGTHYHDNNAASDSGRVFLPHHEKVALEYLAQSGKQTRQGLKAFFTTREVPHAHLPTDTQLSQWIKNKMRGRQQLLPAVEPPRQMVVEHSLEEWPTEMPGDVAGLFLIHDPKYVCNKDRVCIPFSSRGMVQAMQRQQGSRGIMFIDAKQGCLQHGWSMLTGAFSVKDQLRNTTLTRIAGRKVQGTAYTSHAQPALQAMINVESTDNIVQFLMTLQRLWAKHCPDRPPLEEWLAEMHSDYHPALEAARRIVLGNTRPCKDFFHLLEKQSTFDKKLRVVSSQCGQHVKENKSWLIFSLHAQRHLPTLDLSSALYHGFLQRLLAKDEPEIEEYFGPGGHAAYCVQASVKELRTSYGVTALTPDDDATLIFSFHWSGLWGSLPVADCGDQPLEAFHSPWQAQLQALQPLPDATQAMTTMQKLFHTWREQLKWDSSVPSFVQPPAVDVKLWNGPLLRRLGRTPAFDFADASRTRQVHLLHEASSTLHIVVMTRVLQDTFDETIATMAARMVTAHGEALQDLLHASGILSDIVGTDGVVTPHCTNMALVKTYLIDFAFVILRPDGQPPAPSFTGPLCTCVPFCRYAGCEHVEYVKCQDFPLRKATSTAASLPVQQKRGRKRGPLTVRAKVKAAAPKKTTKRRKVTAPS